MSEQRIFKLWAYGLQNNECQSLAIFRVNLDTSDWSLFNEVICHCIMTKIMTKQMKNVW